MEITFTLKPCPFCGDAPEIVPCDPPDWFSGARYVKIRCSNEFCFMHYHDILLLKGCIEEFCCTLSDAAARWNERYPF